jgi:hypothetical protein
VATAALRWDTLGLAAGCAGASAVPDTGLDSALALDEAAAEVATAVAAGVAAAVAAGVAAGVDFADGAGLDWLEAASSGPARMSPRNARAPSTVTRIGLSSNNLERKCNASAQNIKA